MSHSSRRRFYLVTPGAAYLVWNTENIMHDLTYIGPCIIAIVEEYETNLISLVIKFYSTSSMLNMFRTLIHLLSGACDFSIVSPHWSCVLVSVCVGSLDVAGLGWYPCSRLQASACYTDTTPTQPHRNSNTHRNKNIQPMWWYNRKVAGSWWWMY